MKLRISLNMSTLDRLAPGTRAVIDKTDDVDGTVLRLREMGLTDGAEVVVTRRAPLGDPLEVAVRGTRLCLRKDYARRFQVTPC